MVVLALLVSSTVHAAPASESGVLFSGRGGVVLPRTVGEAERKEAAECAGCEWRMTTVCVEEAESDAIAASEPCASVSKGCPQMQRTARIWRRPASGTWRDLGVSCVGDPVTIADVETEVRTAIRRALPALRPTAQPSTGLVTQMPAYFDSGQRPGRVDISVELRGLPVFGSGIGTWTWDFGDAGAVTTAHPGCRYPCAGVVHTYRSAGTKQAIVTARWGGEFWVDGLGPFALSQAVKDSARLDVTVGEGRALLSWPR